MTKKIVESEIFYRMINTKHRLIRNGEAVGTNNKDLRLSCNWSRFFTFFNFFPSKTKFVLSIYYSLAANSKQAILMECTSIRECKIRIKMAESRRGEQNAHLIHEMLKCRCMVNWSVVIKIGVEREVTQCFPRRLKTGDFYAVEVERRIMPHRRARYHRDTLQAVVAHFAPLLWDESRELKNISGDGKLQSCQNDSHKVLTATAAKPKQFLIWHLANTSITFCNLFGLVSVCR